MVSESPGRNMRERRSSLETDSLGGRESYLMSKTETIIGESNSSTISHINLGVKHIGKRSVGKPHAAFDEAGAGNGLTTPALDPTTML
jgi:hypothetical protein